MYTLSFIFDASLQNVLLIHKQRPSWQKGKANGIGGKYEEGESGVDCITREVKEEASLAIAKEAWVHLGTIGQHMGDVDVFTTVYQGDPADAQSTDEEIVQWYPIDQLPPNSVSNLSWFIPLAIDKLKHDNFVTFTVTNRRKDEKELLN